MTSLSWSFDLLLNHPTLGYRGDGNGDSGDDDNAGDAVALLSPPLALMLEQGLRQARNMQPYPSKVSSIWLSYVLPQHIFAAHFTYQSDAIPQGEVAREFCGS
jgi:hypothetical protein